MPQDRRSDSCSAHLLARLHSMLLDPADVVEAVYRGSDPALAAFNGQPTLWIVVGEREAIAQLAPHPLPIEFPVTGWTRSAPLTDFESATKIARLLDEATAAAGAVI